MNIIEVNNLRKEFRISKKKEGLKGAVVNIFSPKYEKKVAVDGINFSIGEGEMVAYIGANGAGKSTTIKMLTGILVPTLGEVIVNGIEPHKNRIRNNYNIGTVFGQRTQLWWDIPVIESYKLIGKIYEMPKERFNDNLNNFTELLNLKELLNIPVRQLSLGQKMRCEIAATFLHDPKIVYLDEPTIGLDVLVKDKIRKFIKEINKERKTTVILTTHDLQDIEELCKRVIIIDNGKIIYDGLLSDIKSRFGNYRLIQFEIKNLNKKILDRINANYEYIELLFSTNHSIGVKFNGEKTSATDVISIISKCCEVADISIKETCIEDIVKDLYRKKD